MVRKVVKAYNGQGNDVIYEYDDGSKETRTGGSRAWRNNNPGNIINSKFADRHGSIGSAGRFAVFPDELAGKEAVKSLFKTNSYRDLSLENSMHRYAPQHENDTDAYVNFVSNKTLISKDTKMKDLSEPELDELANTIQAYEGYFKGEIK